ncbi:MAG: HNH endonuclease [Deltaproteobacteria bacterium]|nr:HNH endonuclease [Deltaproteobacteria bacterium]
MSISDKTRKILWGKSGNRCAICKKELVLDATPYDDESIVGEECHIVSGQKNGPRYNKLYHQEGIDSYQNLLLLCRVHHKMIDDQHETYLAELLLQIKENHEKWVTAKLTGNDGPKPIQIRRIKGQTVSFLTRMNTGREILNLVEGSCAGSYDHDELETQHEVKIVGEFLDIIRDWVDIGSDIDPSGRTEMAFRLSQTIKELEELGFYVFGAKEVRAITGGNSENPVNWPLSIIRVVRKTNPEITAISEEGSKL